MKGTDALTLAQLADATGIDRKTAAAFVKRYRDFLPSEGTGRDRRFVPECVSILKSLERTHNRRTPQRKRKQLSTYESFLAMAQGISDHVGEIERELVRLEREVYGGMDVNVEIATTADFYPLYQLQLNVSKTEILHAPFMQPAELTLCLLSRDWVVLTAKDRKRHVGFIAALCTGVSAVIHFFVTHPEYRMRGVGTALLDRCLYELRERGIASVGGFLDRAVLQLTLTGAGFRPAGNYVWMERSLETREQLA